jgi:hypothetical protein
MNLFEIDRINELAGRAWQTWMQKNQPDGKAIAGDIIPGSDSSSQIITNDIVESVEVFGDVSKDEPDNGKYHDNELDYTFLDFVYGNLISNMASSTSAPEVHSRPEKKYLSSKPSSRMATASSSAVASRPGETRLLKRAQPRGSLDDSVNALKTTGPETGKTNVHGEKISTKIEARPRSTVLRPVSIAKETDVDAAGTSLKMELTEVKDKLDLEGPRNDGQRQWAVDHNERLGGRLDTELENL